MHLIHTFHGKCNSKLKHKFPCILVTFWGKLKKLHSFQIFNSKIEIGFDRNECETLIPVATTSHGLKPEQVSSDLVLSGMIAFGSSRGVGNLSRYYHGMSA